MCLWKHTPVRFRSNALTYIECKYCDKIFYIIPRKSLVLLSTLLILTGCKDLKLPEYETIAELECDSIEEPIKTTPSKIKHIYDGYYEIILPSGEIMKVSGDCVYRSYTQVKK